MRFIIGSFIDVALAVFMKCVGMRNKLKVCSTKEKFINENGIPDNLGRRFILLLSLFVFGLQICSADDDIHKDNIVVILDASGSMQEKFSGDQTKSKMEAAKAALLEVLSKVPDGTHIGLLCLVVLISKTNGCTRWDRRIRKS